MASFYFFLSIILVSAGFTFADTVFIIQMDKAAMPKIFSNAESWFVASLSSAMNLSTSDTVSHKLLYTYDTFHGFSAILSYKELKTLEKSHGFLSSTPDTQLKVDTTRTPDFMNLNFTSGAWALSSYGEDVIIGLVDTGIWPESPSFNDEGMSEVPSRWKGVCQEGTNFSSSLCNKKLIGARYFNKGLLANVPNFGTNMNSTRDVEGHGTHTSSTAAGNYVEGASYFGYAKGTATGMAPRARVAMYKALWGLPTYASDVLAAIDAAVHDGVDILSLSFGNDVMPMYADPIAIGTFSAVERGIFVATSAGNSGPEYGSLHNGIPWVLTVAAGSVDREFRGTTTLGNGERVKGRTLYAGNSTTQSPLVFMNTCNDFEEMTKVGGKIIVCLDRNQSVDNQVSNAQSAEVTGGIFITNIPTQVTAMNTVFPSLFLGQEDGRTVLEYIENASVPVARMEFKETELGTKPAPMVPSYSSRGPSLSCLGVLKPDLMAPGSHILAAWTQSIPASVVGRQELFSNFNLQTGTSMSCPHAAGIAALIKSAHSEWSPAAIRSAMMTTAYVLDNTDRPIQDDGDGYKIATSLAMGAGHVNPNRALDPGLIYDADPQDYVNLLCSLNYTMKQIQTITRTSYNCLNNSSSSDLNYPSFIAFFNENGKPSGTKIVREFPRKVTNVGEDNSTYIVTVTRMDGFNVTVTPGVLHFRAKNQKLSFTLSITGPKVMQEQVVQGAITWEDTRRKYVVRSPIVATRLNLTPLF